VFQDAEWAAREEARRRLMEEVDAIRRSQIAAKQDKWRAGKEAKRRELEEARETERREAAEAAAAAAAAQRKALEQSLGIRTQVSGCALNRKHVWGSTGLLGGKQHATTCHQALPADEPKNTRPPPTHTQTRAPCRR
jgi:hypothetical protein